MNYTAKRYLFEQSAVREFYSGAYYDLFLVMRGSGVFRCSEVVLPAQQHNLLIFKPGQGGRLEYAGAYGPLELIRVQLPPQTLAQLQESVGHIDMMVTGASAIPPSGIRFGTLHGYFDLEWAMLSTKGIADSSTVIIGAGHDCQVADVPVTVEEYDTAIDYIVTPTRIIETRHEFPRPSKGIIWSRLAPGMREQIPPVQELWCEVHCK